MNNKLLKENAILTFYITSFIEGANKDKQEIAKNKSMCKADKKCFFHI